MRHGEFMQSINTDFPSTILFAIEKALKIINNPIYFDDERAYQAELYRILGNEIYGIGPQLSMIQSECPKTNRKHGMNKRPDIIIHIPSMITGSPVNEDNFAVIELKYKSSPSKAIYDFNKMNKMFETLNYPIGIFINVNSTRTLLEHYTGKFEDRIHSFSVASINGQPKIIHSYFVDGCVVVDEE